MKLSEWSGVLKMESAVAFIESAAVCSSIPLSVYDFLSCEAKHRVRPRLSGSMTLGYVSDLHSGPCYTSVFGHGIEATRHCCPSWHRLSGTCCGRPIPQPLLSSECGMNILLFKAIANSSMGTYALCVKIRAGQLQRIANDAPRPRAACRALSKVAELDCFANARNDGNRSKLCSELSLLYNFVRVLPSSGLVLLPHVASIFASPLSLVDLAHGCMAVYAVWCRAFVFATPA